MAEHSVPHFLSIINNQVEIHENLSKYLCHLRALCEIGTDYDLCELKLSTVHHLLWVLGDIVTWAQDMNDRSLHVWTRYQNYPNNIFDIAVEEGVGI